jgi:hypothetical protein
VWRKTVLHFHTTPNERSTDPFVAEEVVARAVNEGIDVLAITDHDAIERISDVVDAAKQTTVVVIPGIEIDTDRGHIVVLAPGDHGEGVLRELAARVGIQPGSPRGFSELVSIIRRETWSGGTYRESVLMIGAHVDQAGSLLQGQQTLPVDQQVDEALMLDAVEVVSSETRTQYVASGLKNTGREQAILQASDAHLPGDTLFPTWIYLPDLTVTAFRHAFCIPEASIRFDQPTYSLEYSIETVAFDGGMHEGRTFSFDPRTTAIIGAPSTGKSLLVDAIRFAFGMDSPIEEVRKVSNSRLNRSLATGTTVTVTGKVGEAPFQLSRTWGGAQTVSPPFRPIVFGQTELVRRAMEVQPSMDLLDIHCPEAAGLHEKASAVRDRLQTSLATAIELARTSSLLAEKVNNAEDGLEATKSLLSELSGGESVARKALEIGRVRAWRALARAAIDAWEAEGPGNTTPDIPLPPTIDAGILDAPQFIQAEAIAIEKTSAAQKSVEVVKDAAERLRQLVLHSEDALAALETESQAELEAAGFGEGSALIVQLEELRARLESLEADALQLGRTQAALETEEQQLADLIAEGDVVRSDLRAARGRACTAVNASMRTFRTRLDHDAYSGHLDGLLEQAKTGTYQRRSSLGTVRDTLERVRLLHAAVLHAANNDNDLSSAGGMEQQDDIARTALERSQAAALAELAGSWPEDGLVIETRTSGDGYQNLTEGMRAVAIKEISFANNALPVVSDQPEDAVPPQNVFQDLVPAIRKQRMSRPVSVPRSGGNSGWTSGVEIPVT